MPTSSRWGTNAVHVGGLRKAVTDEHFALHLAAIEYELSAPITIETEEDILSRKHWPERFEPYEHQVKNLITFCRRSPVALFADDVGLGKTISAGLVLNELQTRKKVRRTLILCPKVLLEQWQEELRKHFGIHSVQAVGGDLNAYLRQGIQVVITTYETARDRMDAIRAASFDMLILDEAHKLRNLHGTPKTPELASKIHAALANRDFKYVLMLTATPIQNRLWDIYSLLDCLSAAKGHEHPLGPPDAFLARYVVDGSTTARTLRQATKEEFKRKVEHYMVRTSRQGTRLAFPERRVVPEQCQASPAELHLQKLVGSALLKLNALARTSLAEALMSSPRALLAQVRSMETNGTLDFATRQRFEDGAQAAGAGCKLAKLLTIVNQLRSNNPGKWRAIVFTRRIETLNLISEQLQAAGITTAAISGRGAIRQSLESFNADPPRANVLVSTDAGAVGLNLQKCNVVINYDLPWNPMILEQRIGRVQRLNSNFKNIEVLNLTVKDSVEDHIVARLLSKLQMIASVVGDIEAILEASQWKDEESFEEKLKELVMRSLMGQDVEEANRLAQKSIQDAKEIYDAQRQQVEATLGGMDALHRSGPAVPKIKAKQPRFDVPTFCRKAFHCDGGTVEELPNGRIRVAPKGKVPWIITFDDDDPDLLRVEAAAFRGTTVQLHGEGKKAFEGLLGEWRKRHAHRVMDRSEESRGAIRGSLQQWADALGIGLKVKQWTVSREHLSFNGQLEVRATASISHDRYEKLCVVEHHPTKEGIIPEPPINALPVDEVALEELLPTARNVLMDSIEHDPDIQEFIKFYDATKSDEVQRSGQNQTGREAVAKRFEVALAAELVGARGSCYATFEVVAQLSGDDSATTYEVRLHIVPLSGKVLMEPERALCGVSGKSVPKAWLEVCSITKQSVLKHLLEISAISGLRALSRYFGTCALSGRRLLATELGDSDVSRRRVGVDLLKRSEITGKKALAEEMKQCQLTGVIALPEELEISEISGLMIRRDGAVSSPVSGIRGHRSEFVECTETHALILPQEGAVSDVGGRFVRQDLLVNSEKNPSRRALESETVKCSVTAKRLLKDEATRSAVSQLWMDKDESAHSAVSARPARRDELILCEITETLLLPDEAGTSSVSGKKVDARLLERSAISGKLSLAEELILCAFTGVKIQVAEGAESEISGKVFRGDQIVQSAVSKLRGHVSEFIRCDVSQDWLLPSESASSDVSGKRVRLDLLRNSPKPPSRRGLESEFETCAVSRKSLLRDEVGRSAVSGKLVDLQLLQRSSASDQMATDDEFVVCEETGCKLLPVEIGTCSVTGKRVDNRLLVKSAISGRMGLPTLIARCQFTDQVALVDELKASMVSGKMCRIDQLEKSEVSGTEGHRSELLTCALSGKKLVPSEMAYSSISQRGAHRALLIASERNPERLGFPDEVVVCAASGKRLLIDEVVKSDLSGRAMDKTVAVKSLVSGRVGLPDEMLKCEESGVTLLPDETAICSVTGKRVNMALLGTSSLSGKRGLARLLQMCPETGRSGFSDEFVTCAATGLHVAPSAVDTCSVTKEAVLKRLMVKCDVSARSLRKDKAKVSDKSGRYGHPDRACICAWTGRQLLINEARKCAITGLDFSSELVQPSLPAEPMLKLLTSGIPTAIADGVQGKALRNALSAVGVKVRGLLVEPSATGRVLCYFGDCSSMFGLKKRHVVGFAQNDGAVRLMEPLCFGQLKGTSWVAE